MNSQQVKWAAQHDWFRSAEVLPGSRQDFEVIACSLEVDKTGREYNNWFRTSNFKELRCWAGY